MSSKNKGGNNSTSAANTSTETITDNDVGVMSPDFVASLTGDAPASISDSTLSALETPVVGTETPPSDIPPADAAFAEGATGESGATIPPESVEAAAKVTPIDPPVVPAVAPAVIDVVATPAPVVTLPPAPPVVVAPVPAPAPVVTPAPAPVVASTTVVVEGDVSAADLPKAIIDSVAAKVSNMAKIHLYSLADYMENMKPRRPVSVADGSRHQVTLYRTLISIINGSEEDFNIAFSTTLRLFAEYSKGVFAESHVFRYFESMSLSDSDRKAFMRLLNLLKIVAPVKGREQALKLVDLVKTLEHEAISEAGRQRIMSFFNK